MGARVMGESRERQEGQEHETPRVLSSQHREQAGQVATRQRPKLRGGVWAVWLYGMYGCCMVYGMYGLYGCMAIPKRGTRRVGCMGRKSRFADFDLATTVAVAPSNP